MKSPLTGGHFSSCSYFVSPLDGPLSLKKPPSVEVCCDSKRKGKLLPVQKAKGGWRRKTSADPKAQASNVFSSTMSSLDLCSLNEPRQENHFWNLGNFAKLEIFMKDPFSSLHTSYNWGVGSSSWKTKGRSNFWLVFTIVDAMLVTDFSWKSITSHCTLISFFSLSGIRNNMFFAFVLSA